MSEHNVPRHLQELIENVLQLLGDHPAEDIAAKIKGRLSDEADMRFVRDSVGMILAFATLESLEPIRDLDQKTADYLKGRRLDAKALARLYLELFPVQDLGHYDPRDSERNEDDER